jgi:hypothetical protein
MTDVPDAFRAYEARVMTPVGHRTVRESRQAFARSVPTMHHATRVFEQTCELLGERAWVDPVGGAGRRLLYASDPDHPAWRIPAPIVELVLQESSGTTVSPAIRVRGPADELVPVDAPEGWKPDDPPYLPTDPRPEVYPRSPDMRGGTFTVREGDAYYETAYGEDGLRRENTISGGDGYDAYRYGNVAPYRLDLQSRPPTLRPVSVLLRADLDPSGHSTHDFARMLTESEAPARVVGRLLLPLPLPGGAADTWTRGLHALRRALWDERVPAGAAFALTDGFDETTLAWGDSLPDAHARWNAEVERVRPRPPKPPPPRAPSPPPEPPPERDVVGIGKGFFHTTIQVEGPPPGPDIPWPLPLPKYVPAVAVPLVSPPVRMPEALERLGFRGARVLLGKWGDPTLVWWRPEDDGWTLVGDAITDVLDADRFDESLRACEREEREFYETETPAGWHIPWRDPHVRFELRQFVITADKDGRPTRWRAAGGTWGAEFDTGHLDGHELRWRIARFRHLR